jgi:hypothetical protein
MADAYPLYLPPDARRLFQSESLLRRMAQTAHWSKTTRLLELFGSLGGLALTKALGCTATVVEPEVHAADFLRDRARAAGMIEKVTFLNQPVAGASFAVESFDAVLAMGRIIGAPAAAAERARTWLAPKGRLGLTVLAKVGRVQSEELVQYWEKRLDAPLLNTREVMMAVEAKGYEPELMESLSDVELDEYYRELDTLLAKVSDSHEGAKALREESRVHRAQNGRGGVTWAFLLARRKEPGEKPPVNRDGG